MPVQRTLDRILGQTRRRLRLQRALEALATAGILWTLGATILVYLLKLQVLAPSRLALVLGLAGLAVIGAAGLAALRRLPVARVAKRIDLSHALHDRLGTALEFSTSPTPSGFMQAQIADAARQAAQVSPRRAAPLRAPRDLRALGLLLCCLGIVAVLRFPTAAVPVVPRTTAPRLAVDAEDLAPHRALIDELEREAEEEALPEMSALARELNRLFDQIQRQELTRKELFAKLAELEKKYLEGIAGDFDELKNKLKKMGDELAKEKLGKEIGENLKKGDLKRAKKDLEDLARQLERLKDREKKSLARTLSKAAQQQLDGSALQKKRTELERQIRRLQRQLKQQAKNEPARRRLERQQRQLQRLNQQQQQRAAQQRQLQRLNQQLQRTAQNLQQNLSPEAQKALQQAAQQLGKFAQQLSRLGMMGKAQGQMMDLKELLRRLSQGKGKQGKLKDFLARAGGKLGQGKEGKEGKEGKGGLLLDPIGKGGTLIMPGGQLPGQQAGTPGQGPDDPNGPPGDGIGTSTNPNVLGKASSLKSQRQDSLVSGEQGKGPTRSEVILGAAEKGFSSQSYRRVYRDYSQVVEDVLKQEDVPLGYRHFVKRYFQLIKPR